jgi:hypothetical protein
MSSWRERYAWRTEFKSLGVRQTSERERMSIWHEEKLQEARRWLRAQERYPSRFGAIATIIAAIAAALIGAVITIKLK